MSRLPSLVAELSAVTPIFLGGSKPNLAAELRPPSIKGLLRYWYRALADDFRETEPRMFGSTAWRSPICVRVTGGGPWAERWNDNRYRQPVSQGGYRRGSGTETRNGIVYMGFSLNLGANERRAVPAGTRFQLEFRSIAGRDAAAVRRAWVAALWVLVHVGGIGSRARRGLGSLRLEAWAGWPECQHLPVPGTASTPEEWQELFDQAVDVLHSDYWFPYPHETCEHTTFGEGARIILHTYPHPSWEDALDDAGSRLQDFRQRRGSRSPAGDYERVKAHLAHVQSRRGHVPANVAPHPLTEGPERAGFGLPLAFGFSNLRPRITFVGTEHGRLASPLFVRVVRLGRGYHALFAKLPAPLLAPGEALKDEADRSGRTSWPWAAAAQTVVDRFMDGIAPQGLEVRFD